MGILDLFRKNQRIAEVNLSNSNGRLEVWKNVLTNITEDQCLTTLFISTVPALFFLLDSPAARMVLYNLLIDINKNDFLKYEQSNTLPNVKDFQINVYRNSKGRPYIKEGAASSLKIKNEIEYLTFMGFFLIFAYKQIVDKKIVNQFLVEVLSNFGNVPLSAVQTYNYITKISNGKFDEMGIKI